ncbi:MAG TPA: four helix bundle protein [Pyrinomonadaceae bacterium]|nr:four helix bundle protein [Pyrinomonadaceae bacterium]
MKYKNFEDLPVWQDAIELAVRVFDLTAHPQFKGCFTIKNQLERAAVSISNNISEGFERGTTQELITSLYISRGSAGESRSVLRLCERLKRFADLRSEISDLITRAISISKQLRAWCDSLQNSDIKGQRYLTDKTRRAEERRRDREAFFKELAEMRERKT